MLRESERRFYFTCKLSYHGRLPAVLVRFSCGCYTYLNMKAPYGEQMSMLWVKYIESRGNKIKVKYLFLRDLGPSTNILFCDRIQMDVGGLGLPVICLHIPYFWSHKLFCHLTCTKCCQRTENFCPKRSKFNITFQWMERQ